MARVLQPGIREQDKGVLADSLRDAFFISRIIADGESKHEETQTGTGG
jgi:hypothetical protein